MAWRSGFKVRKTYSAMLKTNDLLGAVTKSENEAGAVRADHPVPANCGIYYFEITVLSKGKEGYDKSGNQRALTKLH